MTTTQKRAFKKEYRNILSSLGGETDSFMTLCILLPIFIGEEPFLFHRIIDYLLFAIFAVAEIHNQFKRHRTRKIMKWDSFEAELLEKQNFKEVWFGQQFDGVVRFTDTYGSETVHTQKKVQIGLIPRLFRSKGEPRITYQAKCYVSPQNREDIYCAIVANGKDAR